MKAIIDRFEGQYAVCEVFDEKRMINLEKNKLPENAKPGDVLIIDDSGITIDLIETEKREGKIKNLLESLWDKE